jgi:hypothetical protein
MVTRMIPDDVIQFFFTRKDKKHQFSDNVVLVIAKRFKPGGGVLTPEDDFVWQNVYWT